MSSKKRDFEYEQRLTSLEIASRLTAIAEGLIKGELNIAADGKSINLTPSSIGQIGVAARQGKNKGYLTIELSWNIKNKSEDVVEELVDLAKLDAELFDSLLAMAEQTKNGELTSAIAQMNEEKPAKATNSRKTKTVAVAEEAGSSTGEQSTEPKSARTNRNRRIVKSEEASNEQSPNSDTEVSVELEAATQSSKEE